LLTTSGAIVCGLERIDRLITDDRADAELIDALREAGLRQIDLVKPKT
jgi:DeoR/GlpR family transcriptional regulator of sugar metabolism